MARELLVKSPILTRLLIFCTVHLMLAGSNSAAQQNPIPSRQQTSLFQSSHDGQRDYSANTGAGTIPALLTSDIHFDPFHDPAKVQQLVDAPVSRWSAILAAPPSPDQPQAVAALQQICPARGVDTPYALLQSSLRAMRSWQPDARFITVSGDLIAHSFYCRYTRLFPGSTKNDYQAFVIKTLSFVIGELRASFPDSPVYVALGNNDTPCDDYRLDAKSDFLVQAGKIVTEGLPSSQRQQALLTFSEGGFYSVTIGGSIPDTRLIVLNDLFMSPRYRTCAGRTDPSATATQMAWLREQLTEARRLSQRIWVMGHIPPGVDAYSTVAKLKDICGNEAPEMFLSSDELADLLVEYADVVRLGVFGHSHMDEMHLLEPATSKNSRTAFERSVAIKIVPSISPINGNNPSFTVARINPSSAVLQDYQVIAASNQTGIGTTWSREYDYAQTYHEARFSPQTTEELITVFENDGDAKARASEEYIRNFYVGDRSSELRPFWPRYVCVLRNHTAKAFAACVCSTGK
jgi:sphingomyelin phosphodiesterase acid-like 3